MKINTLLNFADRKQRRTLDQIGNFATVISAGSKFSGVLTGSDNYVVHGQVEGECNLEGALVIASSGYWKGNIVAGDVMIAGEVEGDVTATNKVELLDTAKVTGVIISPTIAMAAGAKHSGELRMDQAACVTRYQERRGQAETSGQRQVKTKKVDGET